jgi:hypothetical protein
MSQQNPIRVYVTHDWQESDDYLRVFEYLESARGFFYQNCAKPHVSPGANPETERENLRSQMAACEVVIALASLYRKASALLMFQMTFAQASRKPVLLLPGFGVEESLSKDLVSLATEQVNWDERAMVDAVRRHARGDNTGRWDVVEFKLD